MVSIILHTHLPYVLHHGTWPHGSDWLFEAIAECYLPLLRMCDRLTDEGIRPGITLDISPVLCEQLAHPDLPAMFERYCAEHADLAAGDRAHLEREGADPRHIALTEYWESWYRARLHEFVDVYQRDLLGALRRLQDADAIELMTCGATHGYLPLLAEDASVDLQLRLAVAAHTRHFGRRPTGIWLPECAYRPAYPWRTLLPVASYAVARQRQGIEQILRDLDLNYFVTDEGALRDARPLGVVGPDGVRTPYDETYGNARRRLDERSPLDVFRVGDTTHDATVAVLTRHMQIAMQVWSGRTGYPGDPDYLDFHKKFFRSSLRYWRVTDVTADMAYKDLYEPAWAERKAVDHAAHFVQILEVTASHRMSTTEGETTICLPFDTELFGHWWFEGPKFLEHVLRGIAASDVLRAGTARESVEASQASCVIGLPESSWGRNGTDEVWMNPDTQWTWEREYALEHRTRRLVEKHPAASWDALMRRIMHNAFRQLLLLQASDWQFLITTETAREYASMRFHNHAADVAKLCDMAERYMVAKKLSEADMEYLDATERRDDVFPELLDVLGA
jgi:1,4-alpha-glucan branching enzyme